MVYNVLSVKVLALYSTIPKGIVAYLEDETSILLCTAHRMKNCLLVEQWDIPQKTTILKVVAIEWTILFRQFDDYLTAT